MSFGIARSHEPSNRFDNDHRAVSGHGYNGIIGSMSYCHTHVGSFPVDFVGKKIHVEGVNAFASFCKGKDGVDFDRTPFRRGQYDDKEREKGAAENERKDEKLDRGNIFCMEKNEEGNQVKKEENRSCIEKNHRYRREPDIMIVVVSMITLAIGIAAAIGGYFMHIWPEPFFQNDLMLYFLTVFAAWILSYLLWYGSMHLFVELDLLPGLRRPVFEWTLVVVWLWPLVLSALLGHWLVLIGIVVCQFVFMIANCIVFGPDELSLHSDL